MIVKTIEDVRSVAVEQATYLDLGPKEIAEEADVCERTVQRFLDGETLHPRFFTVVSILRALGYAVSVGESGKKIKSVRKEKVAAK